MKPGNIREVEASRTKTSSRNEYSEASDKENENDSEDRLVWPARARSYCVQSTR